MVSKRNSRVQECSESRTARELARLSSWFDLEPQLYSLTWRRTKSLLHPQLTTTLLEDIVMERQFELLLVVLISYIRNQLIPQVEL